jgi:hypothetical protein
MHARTQPLRETATDAGGGDAGAFSALRRFARKAWALPLALYAVIAVILWLPFGFRTVGLVEEWDLMWLLDRGNQLWWITAHSPLSEFRLRPLTVLPYAIAHSLGEGFLWFNLIALGVFVLRALATFFLVDRIAPGHANVALTAGVLAMLYPANTGLFTFRVFHIQIAVVLFLFALVLLCDVERIGGLWRIALMFIFLAASLLMYQIAILAVVIGPVLLVALGRGRGWRRIMKFSLLWLAPPAAAAAYWLAVASGGGTYELESTKTAARPSLGDYGHDLIRSYTDQVYRAWRPNAWVTWEPRYVAIGAACGVLVALAVLAGRQADAVVWTRTALITGIAAILIAPLGFLPLWAIVFSIHETIKVYLLSSVAVAIGLSLVIGFVVRKQLPFAIVSGVLVAFAAIYGLHQHAYYAALARAESRVLGEMVQQLPSPEDRTTIVVRDHSGQLSMVWTLGPPGTFGAAVEVAYDNPTINVALCDETTGENYVNGEPAQACPGETRGDVEVGGAVIPSNRLAIFDYDLIREMRLVRRGGPGLPTKYAPLRLAGEGRASRAALFACKPIQRCTDPPSDSWPRGWLHEAFDAGATNTTGFRAAETTPTGEPFRWSIARRTQIYAYLPSRGAIITVRILFVIQPSIVNTIRVRVNGRRIPVVVQAAPDGYRVTGRISKRALADRSPDDIEISSNVAPVAGSPNPLGLAVTSLDVTPDSSSSR